jgi:hypothetical protein
VVEILAVETFVRVPAEFLAEHGLVGGIFDEGSVGNGRVIDAPFVNLASSFNDEIQPAAATAAFCIEPTPFCLTDGSPIVKRLTFYRIRNRTEDFDIKTHPLRTQDLKRHIYRVVVLGRVECL